MNTQRHETSRSFHRSRHSKLYRDTEHGMLAGVCAGIANYFGFSRCAVRMVTIALCVFFSPVIILGYIALALLVPKQPEQLYANPAQEEFWKDVNRSPNDVTGQLRHRFRELEQRLRKMEAWVTSKEFEFERELRD